MKASILVLVLSFFSTLANANLNARIQLEDAIKDRVESIVLSYDKGAKVLVRLDFKSIGDILPGTSIYANNNIYPTQIDTADISKANIEVYSKSIDANNDLKELVYKALPLDKDKVLLNFKNLKDSVVHNNYYPLDSQTFSEVSSNVFSNFRNVLIATILICALSCLAFLFYQHINKMNEFKKQMIQLAQAISESGGGTSIPPNLLKDFSTPTEVRKTSENVKSSIDLSVSSLQELFADCYWCQEDQYAHWLWKKLSLDIQKQILNHLSFMRDYVKYFVTTEATAKDFHSHPYYVEPNTLQPLSQEQLTSEVKKQWELWHTIGPIRQLHLPLSLEEKIKANTSKVSGTVKPSATKSQYRRLEVVPTWGEISLTDEEALFEKPDLVPLELKKHVKSLVWLAQKPEEEIKTILTKYDARALASAWIGPDAVLKKLEAALPEKKSNLIKSYKERSTVSRQSQTYLALVREGLDEAA